MLPIMKMKIPWTILIQLLLRRKVPASLRIVKMRNSFWTVSREAVIALERGLQMMILRIIPSKILTFSVKNIFE